MCGRFASQSSPELLRRAFAAVGDPGIASSWNVAPGQEAVVIRRHYETGERRLGALRWGLVPYFTTDLKACRRPINARAENIGGGMFHSAFKSRRCLVPADAFYEWTAGPDGRQPYAFARDDGAPLAFAGLWEIWQEPAGDIMRTFTIVTTRASADLAPLHDRMPVILEKAAWPVWLGEKPGDCAALLRPAPAGTLRRWPVGRDVNTVHNNRPDLLDAVPLVQHAEPAQGSLLMP